MTKTSKNVSIYFNITQIRNSVGDPKLLTNAELRMLIKQPTIPDEQRVELYSGVGKSARYLTFRFFSNNIKDKWVSFDVTKTVREWLGQSGKLHSSLTLFKVKSFPASRSNF